MSACTGLSRVLRKAVFELLHVGNAPGVRIKTRFLDTDVYRIRCAIKETYYRDVYGVDDWRSRNAVPGEVARALPMAEERIIAG